MARFPGRGLSPAAAVRALIEERATLRECREDRTPHAHPRIRLGRRALLNCRSDQGNDRGSNFTSSVSVLTPEEALGCSADLVVLSNLSSSSWELRVPKVPFVGGRTTLARNPETRRTNQRRQTQFAAPTELLSRRVRPRPEHGRNVTASSPNKRMGHGLRVVRHRIRNPRNDR